MADTASTNPYLQPDDSVSTNPYLQPDPVTQQSHSVGGALIAGAQHGFRGLNTQAGEAEQYLGRVATEAGAPNLGQALNDRGTAAVKETADYDTAHGAGLTPEDQADFMKRNAYGIGEMGTQMGVYAGVGAAAGTLGAGAAGVAGGLAWGRKLGMAIANVGALPAMMGLSMGEGTAEKVEKSDTAAGMSPEDAKSDAVKAGGYSAAIGTVGAAALGAVGPLGKAVKFVGSAPENNIVRAALNMSALDVTTEAGQVASKTVLGGATKQVLGQTAVAAGEGGIINAATVAGQQGVESGYGARDGVSGSDVLDAGVTGAAVAGLTHTPSALHDVRNTRSMSDNLANPAADPAARADAVTGVMGLISTRDPALAKSFGMYAHDQIAEGKPIEYGDDSLYRDYSQKNQQAIDDQAAAAADNSYRTTQDQSPNFVPTGDEAAVNAPANIYDPVRSDNSGPPPAPVAPPVATPDLGAAPFPQTYEERAAAGNTGNLQQVIGPIFKAQNIDDMLHAAEQSVANGIDQNRRGPQTRAGFEDESQITPNSFQREKDYFAQQRELAATGERNQNAQQVQDIQNQQAAPPTSLDPFAQRQRQLAELDQANRDQAHRDMERQQLSDAADQHTEISEWQAVHPGEQVPDEMNPYLHPDQVVAKEEGEATAPVQGEAAAPPPIDGPMSVGDKPMPGPTRAKPDSELNPMEFALRRGVQALGRKKLDNLTTEQLKSVADHHPDPLLSAKAQALYDARRNKGNVDQVYNRGPSELTPEGTLTGGERTTNPDRTGEEGVQFSNKAEISPATPLEGVDTLEAKGKGKPKAPAARPKDAISMENTDPTLQKLKATYNSMGKQGDFVRVRDAELPEHAADTQDPKYGTIHHLTKKGFALGDKLADVFGKKAIAVDDRSADGGKFNGVMMPSDDKHVFINVNSQVDHLAVVGHELSHHMERDAPELHKALSDLVMKNITPEDLAAYGKKYGYDTSTDAGKKFVLNEVVADLVGNRATEFRTWQKIFAGADKTQHSLVRRIADFVTHFIDRILNSPKYKKFATDAMVKDLNSVRDNVRQALSDWANKEGVKGIQHDAEQLRAGKENRDQGTLPDVGKAAPGPSAHPIDAEPRADVGVAPDVRAPAPPTGREPETGQGSVEREPIRKPGEQVRDQPVTAVDDQQQRLAEGRDAERTDAENNAAEIAARDARDEANRQRDIEDRTTDAVGVDESVKTGDTVKTPAEKRAETLARKDAEAQTEAERKADLSAKRAAAAKNRFSIKPDDPMSVAISKMGGIKSKDLRDIGLTNNSGSEGRDGNYALGRDTGLQADDMAQRLEEQGYLNPKAGESPRDAMERQLNEELSPGGGKPQLTEEGMQRMFDAYNNQGYQEYVRDTPPEERAVWADPEMKDVPATVDAFVGKHYDEMNNEEAAEFDRQTREWADGLSEDKTGGVADGDIPFESRRAESSDERDAGGDRGAQTADEQATSDAARRAHVDEESGTLRTHGNQTDLTLSKMRHPDLHEIQDDIKATTEEISPQDAQEMVRGATEKPHGVDPEFWFRNVDPRDTLHLGRVSLDMFRENESGNRYDGTVDPKRSADYASRDGESAPPVVGILSTSTGKINILDGGHRISAARERGDSDINAIVEIRNRTKEGADHAEKVAESGLGMFSKDPAKKAAAERSKALGDVTPEQDKYLREIGGINEKETLKDRWDGYKKGLFMRMRQGIADKYAPIEALSKDAYQQIRLGAGVDGTLEALMMYGRPKLDGGTYNVDIKDGGFAKTLSRLGGEHDRFFQWVAAMRANELAQPTKEFPKGREHLYSPEAIKSLMALNENTKANPNREAKFAQALKEYNSFNESVLDIAVKSGILSKAQADDFRDHPYVPFYRMMEGGDMAGPTKTSGLVNQYAYKKLKGGTQKLNEDLLANVMQNWTHLLAASTKNRGAKLALDAAVNAKIADKIEAHEAGKGSVRVLVDGKDEHYVIHDKPLFDAVSAMSAQVPKWMAPISKFKRALTFGVTVSPAFKVRNLIRDSISALAVGDISPNVLKNFQQGKAASDPKSQEYASMLAGGGIIRMGSMLDGNTAARTKQLIRQGITSADKILDTSTKVQDFKDQVQGVWHQYQELGDRSENINRAALYKQLRDRGVSHTEASFQARDMLDFSMGGNFAVIKFLTQSVPFMNARIQGLYKLGRAASTPAGKKRMGYMLGAVAMASIGNYLMYKDDPEFIQREDWDRDNYWWFKVPGVTGAFRIPKPFELGAAGTIAERMVEVTQNKDFSMKDFGVDTANLILNQFSFNPTPQIVKPLVDVYANKDGFTGRPIETAAMQKMQRGDRYTTQTSTAARLIGDIGLPNPLALISGHVERMSPVQVDSVLQGYFGSLGVGVLAATDMMTRPFMGEGERPSVAWAKILSAGTYDNQTPTQSRYLNKMYDSVQQIDEAYTSYHNALKTGDHAKAQQEMADNGNLIRAYTGAGATTRALSQITAQERRIQASTMLSSDAKTDALAKLAQRKNALAKNSVSRMEDRGIN
jgi:hypothetical protein